MADDETGNRDSAVDGDGEREVGGDDVAEIDGDVDPAANGTDPESTPAILGVTTGRIVEGSLEEATTLAVGEELGVAIRYRVADPDVEAGIELELSTDGEPASTVTDSDDSAERVREPLVPVVTTGFDPGAYDVVVRVTVLGETGTAKATTDLVPVNGTGENGS